MRKTILTTIFTAALSTVYTQAQTLQDGLRAIEFEKYEGAKTIFTNLVKQNPANPEYHYYLGEVYLASFNEDSALIAFNAGVSAAPGSGLNYAGLGELKIIENKLIEAEKFFTTALSQNKKDIATVRAVSRAYLAGGTTYADKALEYANKAVEMNKKDMENYLLLGDIYLEKLDASNAVTNYEKSAEVNPKDPRPKVKVANIWLRLKNAQSTLEYLNTAKALDSLYAPVYKTYAKLYYLQGQYAKAMTSYNKFLDLSERSPSNMRQLINILVLSGQYKDALEIINTLMKEETKDIYLYRLEAYSIYEVGVAEKIDSAGFYQKGLNSLDKFMTTVKPEKLLPSDYAYKGKLMTKTGQDSMGIQVMLKSLELDSTNIDIYNEIGVVLINKKKFAEAAVYFDKYISKKARPNVTDYFYLGRSYYFSSQYGKADTAYMKLIELKPDYAEAYYYRAVSNSILDPKQLDTVAKSMYEQFVALAELDIKRHKRNLIESYNYLAVYAIRKGDNEKGKEYLDKILVIDPENKTAKDLLAQMKKQ